LHAHFVVTEGRLPQEKIDASHLRQVWAGDGCTIYERNVVLDTPIIGGQNFYPGWKNGVYQPTTFRLGLFISLCAWFAVMMTFGFYWGCVR
jgi:hypothetical protein